MMMVMMMLMMMVRKIGVLLCSGLCKYVFHLIKYKVIMIDCDNDVQVICKGGGYYNDNDGHDYDVMVVIMVILM